MAKAPASPNTAVAEWVAAGIGGLMTLGVIGYSIFEGVTTRDDHPRLTIQTERAQSAGPGYLVPIVVGNAAHATAAAVEVRGALTDGETVVEESRAVLSYVPGKGEARGGLVFRRDPSAFTLRVSAQGYEEP